MIKKILLAILVIAIIGVCTGVYMLNRKEDDIEDVKTSYEGSAEDITKLYTLNETQTDSLYLDKGLELSGTIAEVGKNQDSAIVITLDSGDPLLGVLCTMRDRNINANSGQQVVIKGYCKGNNMGVVLTRCIIIKK